MLRGYQVFLRPLVELPEGRASYPLSPPLGPRLAIAGIVERVYRDTHTPAIAAILILYYHLDGVPTRRTSPCRKPAAGAAPHP